MLLKLQLREPLFLVFHDPEVNLILFVNTNKLMMLGRIKYERLNVDKQIICAILIQT
jgi:hypothetical protein